MTSQKETSDKSDPPEVPQVLVAQAEAVAGSNIEDETSEHGRLATQRPSKASNSKDASYDLSIGLSPEKGLIPNIQIKKESGASYRATTPPDVQQ